MEIIHLEHRLLSLYRTAFQGRLPTLPGSPCSNLLQDTGPLSIVQSSQAGSRQAQHTHGGTLVHHVQTSPARAWTTSYNPSPATALKTTSKRVNELPLGLEISKSKQVLICLRCVHLQDQQIAKSSHRSLADHLGASLIANALSAPDKLSQDIVRCISSIYCKLSNPPQTHVALSTSPTSSLSSSSIFSSKNHCDSWSPHCSEDTIVNLQGSIEDGPYAAMTEVLKIRLDDDNFNYAALMLQNFRLSTYTA